MNTRFTQRAQQALYNAERMAVATKSNQIETEHLLWGILQQPDGVAGMALKALGVNANPFDVSARKALDSVPKPGSLEPAPRLKAALQIAGQEARKMGVNYIGTEHLLMGILGEGEGQAARWLKENAGVTSDGLRELVYEILNRGNISMPEQNNVVPGMFNAAEACKKPGQDQNGSTPSLDEYSHDLTVMAREERLDPVVGRAKEIQRVIQILSRRTKNNPVLIGEPGVGKTAIVEGLAQMIVVGNVPESLINKRVVSLDVSGMLAGAKYRGEFEDRLKNAMADVSKSHNIILFIDEVHTLVGAGAAEGAIDAANILKPALARGELQCIGATTIDEYRKYIEKDAALERRFQPVMVEEPTPEESIEILKGLRDKYEGHHKVKITDKALESAVKLSHRYLPDRFLPDKAIDLVDEAAAKVKLSHHTAPSDLKKLEADLEKVRKEKEAAVVAQEYEEAAEWRNKEQKLQEIIENQRNSWEKNAVGTDCTVDENVIAQVLSVWSGIPVTKLQSEDKEKLLNLESVLHERVVGQEDAVQSIARAMRRAHSGLKDAKRPIGSFIFLGPTGVGKTELAKALAEALFGSVDAMVRLDMSEYMEKHSVARMIGAPPGYVGHDEGGQLTEEVRRRPYSVVLLDEIEKAHPDVFNALLQLLEDGRLTDSKGRTVDFRNTVIIMTSNVGAKNPRLASKILGFGTESSSEDKYEEMKTKMLEELKQTFRPEFINRVDEIIVFHALTQNEIQQIAALMLKEIEKRLVEQELTLEIEPEVIAHLAKTGFDEAYGARPLRRSIQRQVEDPLAEAMLQQSFKAGDTILVKLANDKIIFKKAGATSDKTSKTKSTKPAAKKQTKKENAQEEE